MKYLIIVAVAILFNIIFLFNITEANEGKTVVYANTFSYHTNRTPRYNEKNYGIGFRKHQIVLPGSFFFSYCTTCNKD